MFSKKATKIDEIFTINLTLCSKCQFYGKDFVNFCGNPSYKIWTLKVLLYKIWFKKETIFSSKINLSEYEINILIDIYGRFFQLK